MTKASATSAGARQRRIEPASRSAVRSAKQRASVRLGQGRAHEARRRDRGIEPGVVDHLDDRPHPLPLGADAVGDGALVLDLGRGVRAIAELVLETLDPDGVPPVLQPARNEEAGEPAGGLREREEPVRHGGRAEPLVAGEPPAPIRRLRPRGRRAKVGAALPFRHRHAERGALLIRQRKDARVVLARDQLGAPRLLERGLGPQRGDRGMVIVIGQQVAGST
jgi:hypothetical protein